MPSAVGYQPTLATEMGELQERITSTKNGSITSVQAVYVPADDLTDPAPATTFAHLGCNNCTYQERLSEQGIYPAVDPLESSSRILEPDIVGEEHYEVAERYRKHYRNTKNYRISSLSLVWKNYLMKIRQSYSEQERFRNSYPAIPCSRELYRYPKVFMYQ